MDNFALASFSSPKLLCRDSFISTRQLHQSCFLLKRRNINRNDHNNNYNKPRMFFVTSSALSPNTTPVIHHHERLTEEHFASISSSKGTETTSVGVYPQKMVPPPSQFGSPLFWIGVGVGFSAFFSWAATNLKKYAMQQAMKTMMGQMSSQNNQFSSSPFSPGTPFPFPTPPVSQPASPFPYPPPPASQAASQPSVRASQASVAVNVPATKVEGSSTADVTGETKVKTESNKYAFVDVSPEDTLQSTPFESFKDADGTSQSSQDAQFANEVSTNGSASKQGTYASDGPQSTGKASGLSVEALEKMMEDPTVQKMVYPYLPEEMRDPATFKWMLQNPQYRQQLEDMLNNMSGGDAWNTNMMDSLKNFDLSSPEVKQQFDQIGLTPEEVISKIMANPDVAMAFQNPRVQAAIMDCSQNPMSIAKYQNDKEVMDVFNKISQLFPGVSGSP